MTDGTQDNRSVAALANGGYVISWDDASPASLVEYYPQFERLSARTAQDAVTMGRRAAQNVQLAMYASDICTIPTNLAALPGMSIPSGLSGGLPVGFQIMGPAFSENKMLSVAWTLEQAFGFDPVPTRLRDAVAGGAA